MASKPKQSKHFKHLTKNLSQLEKTFLSMKMKPDGSYNLTEQVMARAYALLSHAEIENYFENVASEVVTKAYKKWISDRKPSLVLMSVTALRDVKEKTSESTIENRMQEYINNYQSMISKNNGIKEDDLLKILLPLGINLTEIDTTFLNSMDSFGHDRGEIAHKSIKTQSLIDPFAKKKDVTNILTEIGKLDNKIISLK